MRSVRSLVVGLAAIGVVVAGCGPEADRVDARGDGAGADGTSPPPVTTVDAGDDIDGTWVLSSGLLGGEAIDLVEGREVTLTIDGASVSGRAACNGYGASLGVPHRTGGGPFGVSDLSWTEMGCEPAVMELERRFLDALQVVDSFELAGGALVLAVADGTTSLVFEPVAPVPAAEIVGTTWVLDTVIEGEAASHSDSMAMATLRLDPDGTLAGSTSCRRLDGEWIVSGAEVVFTSFAAIDDPAAGVCSPESSRLDATIVTVLGDGFAADVDGDRLTLAAADGLGLSYLAG